MARTRSTPYSAQLERFLSSRAGQQETFSAATLAQSFDHPPQQRRQTTIGGIHKALMRAFADGKIISFVDESGGVLRGDEARVHGSKAVGQPQIFGLPGTQSPAPTHKPVTYEETMRGNGAGHHNGDQPSLIDEEPDLADEPRPADDGERADPPAASGLATAEDESSAANASELTLTADAARARFKAYLNDPPQAAPEWVPTDALREWATKPNVIAHWRRRLHDAPMQERLALIQAGVPRKGEIVATSPSARGLANLCRRPGPFWRDVINLATAQYVDDDEGIDPEQLAEFAHDPISFYLDHDRSPFVLLLCGVVLELAQEQLRELAAECEHPHEGEGVERETAEAQARIGQLESLLSDAKRGVRDAAREITALTKERDALAAKVHSAQEATQQADDKRDEQIQAELAAVRVELEVARTDAERVAQLEQEIEALERSRDALLSEGRSAQIERKLREEIEAQMQDQMRELGELRARLRATHEHGAALPTDTAPALLRALARPLGDAARLAGERLAAGQTLPHDDQLLTFAAELMQTLATISDASTVAPKPEIAAPPTGPELAEARIEPEASAEPAVPETAEEDGDSDTPAKPPAKEPAAAEPQPAGDERPMPLAPLSVRRRRGESWFTVRPLGGAGEIGGSALLVETRNHHRVLLDAGQRVKNEYGVETHNQFHRGIRGVDRLHGILISHAHIDHVGSLPLLWRFHSDQQDSEVPVWMTAPTRELARIMLRDSAKIQNTREYERDVLGESDFDVGSIDPAYAESHVNDVMGIVSDAEAYKPIRIPDTSLAVKFLPVSHVLGSCAIHIKDLESGHTLLYTGDLGPIAQPQLTLPDFGGTELIDHADTVIMESTYGVLKDSEREGKRRTGAHGRAREVQILFDAAEQTLARGGFVLMPSFSLGRTQELVRLIGDRVAGVPIYIGGMGERIFEVYDAFQRKADGAWVRPGSYPRTTSIGKRLRGSSFEEVVENVLEGEPGFIIASPAMLSGGWSRAFLRRMIEEPQHAVIFSGYLPRHGVGIPRLRELGKNRPMRYEGEHVKIQCDWVSVGLSAHAPAQDLRAFARDMANGREHVNFGVVHGEAASQRELAADISQIDNATAKSLSNGEPWTPSRP
jgi:predicted metal-dependent RNase